MSYPYAAIAVVWLVAAAAIVVAADRALGREGSSPAPVPATRIRRALSRLRERRRRT